MMMIRLPAGTGPLGCTASTVPGFWWLGCQDPGTVLALQPSGRVPAGSLIIITAAYRLHHGDGHGPGNGQGNGDGGD